MKHWNKEGEEGGQKTGINHNYNQRARKLHRVRPLWRPRDSVAAGVA